MKKSKFPAIICGITISVVAVLLFGDIRLCYAVGDQANISEEKVINISADDTSREVIEAMTSLAKSGPNLSLADVEKMLGFTAASKSISNGELHVVCAGTNKWSMISLDFEEDESKLKRVGLTVDPNYALLNSAFAIAKLGLPTPQLTYSDHDPKQSLIYNTEHYDLVFYTPSRWTRPSSALLANSINSINVAWITPEQYLRRVRIRKAWEDQRASIGTCTQEMLNWLKALVKLPAVPTSQDLMSIFGSEGEIVNGVWTLRRTIEDQNVFPSRPYFYVSYLPKGSDQSAAQLIVSPGSYSHTITLDDIKNTFGPGTVIDGTTLTPRETGTVHLSFQLPHGSMSVLRRDYKRDGSVANIQFWWKPPNSSSKILEEVDQVQTLESVIAQARVEMARKQFDEARKTLQLASNKRPALRCKNVRREQYEIAKALKAGYVDWYELQGKMQEVKFLQHVCLIEFAHHLNNLDCAITNRLPTVEEYRKGFWKVTVQEHVCYVRRENCPPMDVNDGPTLERCKRLFGVSETEKRVVDIPAELLDAMYYEL